MSDMSDIHKPVLLNEIVELLCPQSGKQFIDATINGGGHTRALLSQMKGKGGVLGIDLDCDLIERLRQEQRANLSLVCGNYADITMHAKKHGIGVVDGVIADLGFSSYHIDASGRGFSFLRDEPLDMRYSPQSNEVTATRIVNEWSENDISHLVAHYGEERFAARIARAIVRARGREAITRSTQLAEIIKNAVPGFVRRGRIHPATRTFQALRIEVNREFENLERFLAAAPRLLARNGVLAIITFHSIEDRMVKQKFRAYTKEGDFELLTKKPISSSYDEIHNNPRARSAKMRAIKLK